MDKELLSGVRHGQWITSINATGRNYSFMPYKYTAKLLGNSYCVPLPACRRPYRLSVFQFSKTAAPYFQDLKGLRRLFLHMATTLTVEFNHGIVLFTQRISWYTIFPFGLPHNISVTLINLLVTICKKINENINRIHQQGCNCITLQQLSYTSTWTDML